MSRPTDPDHALASTNRVRGQLNAITAVSMLMQFPSYNTHPMAVLPLPGGPQISVTCPRRIPPPCAASGAVCSAASSESTPDEMHAECTLLSCSSACEASIGGNRSVQTRKQAVPLLARSSQTSRHADRQLTRFRCVKARYVPPVNVMVLHHLSRPSTVTTDTPSVLPLAKESGLREELSLACAVLRGPIVNRR